ncbi:DUF1987 domain-containing protein [Zavarzinia sp. CC-PAN008]|uniref:DUF1987 domain-containing protein n=1 Tax=Zavarzinia sp. CC-PAN008 TaxID=3243332 RepID=UPI003F742CB4
MTAVNEAAALPSDRIVVVATDRSPAVDFDFATGRLSLKGESYPEDAAAFFGPLINGVRAHLTDPADAIVFDLELAYFNSSSAKAIMNLFQVLERTAQAGASVTINWHYAADDEAMQEFGEDFAEDFESAQFNMCAKS